MQSNELTEIEHNLLVKCLFILSGKKGNKDPKRVKIMTSEIGATTVFVECIECGTYCILHSDHYKNLDNGEQFDSEIVQNLAWHFTLDEGDQFGIEYSIYDDQPESDIEHNWHFQVYWDQVKTKDILFKDTITIKKIFIIK